MSHLKLAFLFVAFAIFQSDICFASPVTFLCFLEGINSSGEHVNLIDQSRLSVDTSSIEPQSTINADRTTCTPKSIDSKGTLGTSGMTQMWVSGTKCNQKEWFGMVLFVNGVPYDIGIRPGPYSKLGATLEIGSLEIDSRKGTSTVSVPEGEFKYLRAGCQLVE